MSEFVGRESQSSKVKWGNIVAGAAVATGVVLVGLAIGGNEVPILSDIAEGVKQLALITLNGVSQLVSGFTTAAPPAPDEVVGSSVFAKFGEYLGDLGVFLEKNSKFLGGAALLGAGSAYMATHSPTADYQPVPAIEHVNARLQNAQMGFLARAQMRSVNALMQSRMSAFGGAPAQDGQDR